MRLLIGIDQKPESISALALAARLGFRDANIELLHVLPNLDYLIASEVPLPSDVREKFHAEQQLEAEARLRAAKDLAIDLKITPPPRCRITQGYAVTEILKAAEHCDMIAVGSDGHGNLAGAFFDSVSRKLAVASPTSFLVARPRRLPDRPLKAVFATDHSDYANRCADRLAKFCPSGIQELTVMTAYPQELVRAVGAVVQHFKSDMASMVQKHLEERNAKTMQSLQREGLHLKSAVIHAGVTDAINRCMVESEADLLILGAQGHGFFDRWLLGSIAFEQVMNGRYHTLVIRA